MTDLGVEWGDGAAVPVNLYWIAGHFSESDPPGGPARPWAQLIVTTAGGPPMTREAASLIVRKTRQTVDELALLGPYPTPTVAGRAQTAWLALQSVSPVQLFSVVKVETVSGEPVHPVGVQQAVRMLAPWQPVLDIDDDGPALTVTLASINPGIAAAADAVGLVLSAFGYAEDRVEFRSVTIATADTFRATCTAGRDQA